MTIIAMTLATRADDAADGAGQPADAAEQLAAEVRRLALGHQAERRGEAHQAVELRGDDLRASASNCAAMVVPAK